MDSFKRMEGETYAEYAESRRAANKGIRMRLKGVIRWVSSVLNYDEESGKWMKVVEHGTFFTDARKRKAEHAAQKKARRDAFRKAKLIAC